MFAATFSRGRRARWKASRQTSRRFWSHLVASSAPGRPRVINKRSLLMQLWMDPYALMVNMTTLSFVVPYLASGLYMRLKHTNSVEKMADPYEEDSSIHLAEKNNDKSQFHDWKIAITNYFRTSGIERCNNPIHPVESYGNIVIRIRQQAYANSTYSVKELVELGHDIRCEIENEKDHARIEDLTFYLRLAYEMREKSSTNSERNSLRLPMAMAIHALLRRDYGKRALDLVYAFLASRPATGISPRLHSRTLYHVFSTFRSKYYYVTHRHPGFEDGHLILLQTLIFLLREEHPFISGELVNQVIEWLVWLGCLSFASQLWGVCMLFHARKHRSTKIPPYLAYSANVILESIGIRHRNNTEESKVLHIFLNLDNIHGIRIRTSTFFRLLRTHTTAANDCRGAFSEIYGSKRLTPAGNAHLMKIMEVRCGLLFRTPRISQLLNRHCKVLLQTFIRDTVGVRKTELPLFENDDDSNKAWNDEYIYNHPIFGGISPKHKSILSTTQCSSDYDDKLAEELVRYASTYLGKHPLALHRTFDFLFTRNLVNISTFNNLLKHATRTLDLRLGYLCIERVLKLSKPNFPSTQKLQLNNAFLSNLMNFLKAAGRRSELEFLIGSIVQVLMKRLATSLQSELDYLPSKQNVKPFWGNPLLEDNDLPSKAFDPDFLLSLTGCAIYIGKTGLCEKIWAICQHLVHEAQENKSDYEEKPLIQEITGASSCGYYPPRKRRWKRPIHKSRVLRSDQYTYMMRLMNFEIERGRRFNGSEETIMRKDNKMTSPHTVGWFYADVHNWYGISRNVPYQESQNRPSFGAKINVNENEGAAAEADNDIFDVELYGLRPLHLITESPIARIRAARVGAWIIYNHAITKYKGIVYPDEKFFNAALDIYAPLQISNDKVIWDHDSNTLQNLSKILQDIKDHDYAVPWGFIASSTEHTSNDPSAQWRIPY